MKTKKKSPRKPTVRFKFADGTHTDMDLVEAIAKGRTQNARFMGLADKELMHHTNILRKERAGAQKGIDTIKDNVDSKIRQAANHYNHVTVKHPQWPAAVVYDHICQKLNISRRTLDKYLAVARATRPPLIPLRHRRR